MCRWRNVRRIIAGLCLTLLVGVLPAVADVRVRVVRKGAITTTGNDDYTVSGFGTPKGWLLFVAGAVTDATVRDHALFTVGAGDCTNYWSSTTNDRDALATSEANRRNTSSQAVQILDTTGSTVDGEGTASCITDGIRINWTTALGQAYFLHVVLFGGTDVTTKAGTYAGNGTLDATTVVSTVGFQFQDMLIATTGSNAFDGTSAANARQCLGIVTVAPAGGTPTSQGHTGHNAQNGQTTQSHTSGVHTAWGGGCANDAFFTGVGSLISAVGSAGFTATTKQTGAVYNYGYFAWTSKNTVRSWSGQFNAPAGTGSTTMTSGFTPQFALLLQTGVATSATTSDATDAHESDGDAGLYFVSIMDGTNQYNFGITGQDTNGVLTSNTASYSDNQAIHVLTHTQTDRWVGTLTGMGSTGPVLNFTTTSGTAAWWGWAVEVTRSKKGGAAWIQ